jgi:putative methionine-R-sulfoxide reductase with GAF domain
MLGSTTPNAYREAERDLLRADEIADVMRDLSAALRKRRRDVLRKMRNMFQPHLPPDVVAAGFVTTLAHENDWDFVGVYRVDRQFALVASCDRTRGSVLKLNPNYRQNLDVGMLGRTLRARKCLRSDDVTTKSASHGYIKVDGFNARSVLCYPIFVSGNVEWILNCASTAHSAFRGPDREMLDELVDGLQLTVNLWFETRLSTAILDGLTEPVVVTDREGTIQRANRAGRAVFGLMAGGPTSLADFAVDEAGRRLLQPDRTVSSDCVTMMTAMQQEPRDFIVTSSLPSEAFGQLVYKFSDKREQEWLAGLDHARQVVETEVGQARAVLMLASALVSRARAELRAGEVFDSVDKTLLRASEAISKTDLSYGRLVQATTGKTDGGANRFVLNTLVEMASAALAAPAPSSGIAGTSPDATIAKAIVAIARRLIGGAAGARATLDALPGVKTP